MLVLKRIEKILDGITMYKMVIYGLLFMAVLSFVFSFAGVLVYTPAELALSLGVLLGVSLLVNWILAKTFRAPVNHESTVITALILFFLLAPVLSTDYIVLASVAALAAIASKYILAIDNRHILNPAAVGAAVLGFLAHSEAVWWASSLWLFVPTVIAGALIVWKIRRFALVASFLLVGLVVFALDGLRFGDSVVESTYIYFFSWPSVFLATFMLTEPLTTPWNKRTQILYGAFVALLINTSLLAPWVGMTPELGLLVGNMAALPFLLRKRLTLEFVDKYEIAKNTWEFVFKKPEGFSFIPGQYLEWTIPHAGQDKRGIRRYFTIASGPTEPNLKLGVRVCEEGSTYKKELMDLSLGESIYATQLSGDFLIPEDKHEKSVFIAGGIGITPFRSMLQHILEEGDVRDVVLFYTNRTPDDIAYADLFEEVKEKGVKTVHVISEKDTAHEHHETGFITKEMLEKHVPDYKERVYYLSGPHAMVVAYKKLLKGLGVSEHDIKTDYFPGLA